MAQPSIACYFNARKRSAIEDTKINHSKKVLILDANEHDGSDVLCKNESINVIRSYCDLKDVSSSTKLSELQEKKKVVGVNKIVSNNFNKQKPVKKMVATRTKALRTPSNNGDIQNLFNNMKSETSKVTEITVPREITNHITPPNTPTKTTNALDKVRDKPDGPSLKEIKRKMTRSARLAELKASIGRFQDNVVKLKEIEKKTSDIPESPKLKSFRTIELEVHTR